MTVPNCMIGLSTVHNHGALPLSGTTVGMPAARGSILVKSRGVQIIAQNLLPPSGAAACPSHARPPSLRPTFQAAGRPRARACEAGGKEACFCWLPAQSACSANNVPCCSSLLNPKPAASAPIQLIQQAVLRRNLRLLHPRLHQTSHEFLAGPPPSLLPSALPPGSRHLCGHI